MLHYGLTL